MKLPKKNINYNSTQLFTSVRNISKYISLVDFGREQKPTESQKKGMKCLVPGRCFGLPKLADPNCGIGVGSDSLVTSPYLQKEVT